MTGFYAGGLIGQSWNGTQYYDITGSLYVGNVTTTASDGAAGAIVGYQATDSNSCTFTNVFWNENDGLEFYGKRDTTSQVYSNTSSKTAEAFASGEVAWILNNGVTDGSQVWYQNLDMDAYPLLAGPAVYFGYSPICTDTEPIYSNAPGYLQDTPADHTYVADCDATCEYCDTVREISADHDLEYQNDGSQHWQYCSACQGIWNSGEHSMIYEDMQTGAHKYYREVCGYIENTEGHWYESADLGDGTHDYHCIYCGRITTSAGEHTLVYTDMEDGTHKSSCDMCGYAGQPVVHTLISVDNWDDTHTRKCKWCSSIQGTEKHTFENKGCWNVCSCGRATENYDSHSFDADGFCTACGGYQKPTVEPGEDPEWDYDDVYLIYNAGQLFWFADYVNNVNNGIAAKRLDDTYYVAGVYTDADGNTHCTGVVAYSVSQYCLNKAVDGCDMQQLACATAMYGYYAK